MGRVHGGPVAGDAVRAWLWVLAVGALLGFIVGLGAGIDSAHADAPSCECKELEELAAQARRQTAALERIAERVRP